VPVEESHRGNTERGGCSLWRGLLGRELKENWSSKECCCAEDKKHG